MSIAFSSDWSWRIAGIPHGTLTHLLKVVILITAILADTNAVEDKGSSYEPALASLETALVSGNPEKDSDVDI